MKFSPSNKKLLDELQKVGISLASNESKNDISRNDFLEGKTFVITGSMMSSTRQEIEKLIESAGGKVVASISKKTTYLIAGSKPGSKLEKAKNLGTKIIDEDKFQSILYNKSSIPN